MKCISPTANKTVYTFGIKYLIQNCPIGYGEKGNIMDILGIIKYVTAIVLVLELVVTGYILMQKTIEYAELKEAVKAGEIVDKQMAVSGGFFSASTVIYRFYVSGEVEHNDELCTVEKAFVVTENIYNQYSVGDWFDSQNLITSDEVVSDIAA